MPNHIDLILLFMACLGSYMMGYVHGETYLCEHTCKGLQFDSHKVDRYDGVNVCECW